MEFAYGQTVVVFSVPKKDEFGNPIGKPQKRIVKNCAVSWVSSLLSSDTGRVTVATEVTLLVPPQHTLAVLEQVQLADGSWWYVQETPQRPVSPFSGWRPGVKAKLRSSTTPVPPEDDKKKDDKKKPDDKDKKKKEEGEPIGDKHKKKPDEGEPIG